ncbi:MAG TPA: hydroxyacylglutathione hydrolase C-terminal domain-containing protein, partial [Casimicrobium sp.]|nr:hydroxyacylglutathione hydrolase C-terminal domain-containing protein [Casimicrobium sp.]
LRFALAADADNEALIARSFEAQEQRARGEPTLPSTIGLERKTNPFLRCDTAPVMRSARASANLPAATQSNEVDVFALLRQWKNTFRG